MKGFVRILEAVLASLILIMSLSYFFEPIVKYSEWSDTVAMIETEDVLIALYKSGKLGSYVNYADMDEFERDKNAFNGNLSGLLPRVIDFSIEVNGRPNPIIFIGCNCTDTEKDRLTNLLSPLTFMYKNRVIEIRIEKVDINKINSITPYKPDILFLLSYKNLGEDIYRYHVEDFLDGGGTIFMLANLASGNVNDGFLNTTFGLRWDGTAPSNPGQFYDANNVNKTSYKIASYYENVSGMIKTDSFDMNTFSSIKADNNTVIISANGLSFLKINHLPSGRTVWSADFTADNKTRNMTKAVVMWASGESYSMDEYVKTIPGSYTNARLVAADAELYEINLIFWKVFY